MSEQKTAIIIGAGPAGLTAAYKLLKETDIKPIILEESEYIGGISRTARYNGNRMDMGGHRFFSKVPEVNAWWEKMMPAQGAPAKDDIILSRGWYAPAGMNGAELVRRLLSVSPAPIVIDDDAPALTESIVAEDGETHLSMSDRILNAMGWILRINGNGTINIMPAPLEPAAGFDPLGNDVIETKIKVSSDWYSCPNVYVAVADNMTGVARDESIDSPLSIQNRGREVWKQETGCKLAANESIAAYAARKLAESQKVQQTASYDRRYIPDVYPGDLVTMNYPQQNLVGVYQVTSQSITLGYGAKTSEQISKETR